VVQLEKSLWLRRLWHTMETEDARAARLELWGRANWDMAWYLQAILKTPKDNPHADRSEGGNPGFLDENL
jgi:hypothetical protein